MSKQILARIIIEMLGAPQDYITKTMHGYIEKLKGSYKVLKSEISDAEPKEQVFSLFAELEMQFKDLQSLIDFCFESMPSSVEIVEPSEFVFKLDKMNAFLNDLQSRLHEADAIIKGERTKQQLLDINTTNIFKRFILHLVEKGPKTAGEISHYIGVKPNELTPFLNKLVKDKKMKKDGENYSIA